MLTSSRLLDCYALMKPSFYDLFSRFSVTLELHYALKALKHVWPKSTLRFCTLTGESFLIHAEKEKIFSYITGLLLMSQIVMIVSASLLPCVVLPEIELIGFGKLVM